MLCVTLGFLGLSIAHSAYRGIRFKFDGDTIRDGLVFRFYEYGIQRREPEYIKCAVLLNEWNGPGNERSVGLIEIGVLGYYYEGHVLDSYGLTSPEVLNVLHPDVEKLLPADAREHPYNTLMYAKPEYIVMSAVWYWDHPESFTNAYQPYQAPGTRMNIFIRKDIASSIHMLGTRLSQATP